MLNHINDLAYMASHGSTMYALAFLTAVPLSAAAGKGIYEGIKSLIGLHKERKAKEAGRLRLERA
ncbi:MAG: hypothetical protein ACREBJ_09290, partial [Nitrosotalea sp.]